MRRMSLLIILNAFWAVPCMAQLKPIPSGVYHWADAPVSKSADREGRKIMEGSTAELDRLEVHATTQQKGAATKPAHAQTDVEELIFVKEGTMRSTIGANSKILTKGSIILIPPHQMQSVLNVGDGPLTYYVLGFRAKKPVDMDRLAKGGGAVMLSADSLKYVPTAKGGGVKYFDRPTAMLDHLEMHITELKGKGPSHAPHTHIDTELVIMLTGDAEMMIDNQTYKATAGDIYLANSNQIHGIGNPTDAPCKYLAIRWY